MICSRCGRQVNAGAKFCVACGNRIETPPSANAQAAPASPLPRQACPQCGNPCDSKAKFCVTCGKRLQDMTASRPAAAAPASPGAGYYGTAPYPARTAAPGKPKPHRGLVIGLAAGIPALALIVILLVILLPKPVVPDGDDVAAPSASSVPAAHSSAHIGADGGSLAFKDFSLNFGNSAVNGTVNITVTDVTAQQETAPAGLQSPLYEVKPDQSIDKPITVRIKLPDGADTTHLMLGVGSVVVSADGKTSMISYKYIDAKIVDGALEASLVPADYAGGIGFFKTSTPAPSSSMNSPANDYKPHDITAERDILKYGIFKTAVFYKDGGKFRVIYPDDNKAVVTMTNAYQLLDDLQSTWREFQSSGFNYDRRKTWPIDVNIVPLFDRETKKPIDGAYDESGLSNTFYGRSPEHGYLNLNVDNFEKGYNQRLMAGVIGHEWFHFVQANYASSGITSAWLADATACWYEYHVAKREPDVVEAHLKELAEGIIPAEGTDSAGDGYGRAPVVEYLVNKLSNKWILKTYEAIDKGTNPCKAFLDATALDPKQWAADCYEYIFSGNFITATPSGFYEDNAASDRRYASFDSALNLKTPTADELTKAIADQKPLTIGEQPFTLPPLGARPGPRREPCQSPAGRRLPGGQDRQLHRRSQTV